ncbi:SAP domain-containing protein [Colletotrichum camelliae]|nr:SAP domain-containing protein [Colletotrichum camelliae]
MRKTLDSRVNKPPLAFATIQAIDPTSSVPDTCKILPAAGSQKPPSPSPTMSSSHMDMDDPETLLEGSQKSPKKTPKKILQYPADIPRLTRFGRGTYGIKTGPLPDGTDWSKLSVDIIKEQLMMRNVPTDGRKQVLVHRLQNWQTYYDGQTVDVRPSAEGISPTPQSTKKQRNAVPVNDHRHIKSTKKAMTQRMFVIKQYANDEWGDPNQLSLAVRGAGNDVYTVTVAHETSCTCSAAKFNPRSNCKHVIYVLTHVLRAPAEVLPQRRISVDELATIFARAPKIRPTQMEIDNDPAFKDGVPKPKEGKDCSVCYQPFDDLETVCCGTCGHHAHTGCFAIFAQESSGWGTKCPTCQAKWNPAGKPQQDV